MPRPALPPHRSGRPTSKSSGLACRPPIPPSSWPRRARSLAGAAALVLLAACATPHPPIDSRHTAQGQDSRVQWVVLHFTSETLAGSLRILTTQQVSAHYLVGDEPTPMVYRLVDESRRACTTACPTPKPPR